MYLWWILPTLHLHASQVIITAGNSRLCCYVPCHTRDPCRVVDPANHSEKRIQAFETKCLRKLLCISHLEHKTNNRVLSKIKSLVGPQEPFLTTAKRWKLAWFGHVTLHNSLSKTILQGTLEGGQCRGWQRKCWMDNIKERTSLPNFDTDEKNLRCPRRISPPIS